MPHTLLLADDSVTIQRVIELTFADENIRVVAVSNGQQAIAKLEADRPDVVLADVGMPEKDGYEVAAYVKGQAHLRHIPVVLLTGAFEPVDETRAQALGCEGVLVKPFEPQMVINRVKDLIAGRRSAALWATSPADFSRPEGLPGPLPAERPLVETPPTKAPRVEIPPVEAPAVTPSVAVSAEAAVPGEEGGESLDEYFDRLDAAFGTLDSRGAAVSASEPDTDPMFRAPVSDVGDLREPILATPSAAEIPGWDAVPSDVEVPAVVAAPDRATDAPEPAGPPSLADAFAALLAAEQGQPLVLPRPAGVAPASEPAPPPQPPRGLSDEEIEAIVQQVIQRLTTSAVRETVVEVAERLVREEIERIKGAAL